MCCWIQQPKLALDQKASKLEAAEAQMTIKKQSKAKGSFRLERKEKKANTPLLYSDLFVCFSFSFMKADIESACLSNILLMLWKRVIV